MLRTEHYMERPPAETSSLLGPGPGLIDVPAGGVDGPLIPVGELGVCGHARCAHSAPSALPNADAFPPPTPCLRRAHQTRARPAPS